MDVQLLIMANESFTDGGHIWAKELKLRGTVMQIDIWLESVPSKGH